MPRISEEDCVTILRNADSISIANGESKQTVGNWLLQPCEAHTFHGEQITQKVAKKLAELQDHGLINMHVKVGDFTMEFPLVAGEFQLDEATGRFEPWRQSVKA